LKNLKKKNKKLIWENQKRMRTRKISIKVPEIKIIIQEVSLALLKTMITEELQVAVTKVMMVVDTTDNHTITIMTNIITMINTMTIMVEKTLVIEAMEEAITTKATTTTLDEVVQTVVAALTRIKGTITKIINKGIKTTTTLAIEDSKIRRINNKTTIMTTELTILNNITRKELTIHKISM
jgi:hypothetical protein